MKKFSLLLLAFSAWCSTGLAAAFLTRTVRPTDTDPALHPDFNAPHYVVLATNVPPLGKLLLHLPGTGSNPAGATNWLRTAAALGYHAIGLKYQNDPSMATVCTVNINLNCFDDITDETVTGQQYADELTSVPKQVTRADSIENRVQKLLAGLVASAPASENWSQFLDGTGAVQWSKIAVSGHSQGGSCALFIAKTRTVDRAVLFATVDWIRFPTNSQPAWFRSPSVTPPERLYGFTHRNDSVEDGFWQQPPIWDDLQITPFGLVTLVESNAPPYLGSHTLTSLLAPGAFNDDGSPQFHVSVIRDEAAPRTATGTIAWLPAWSYMLTNDTATTQPPPTNASLTLVTNVTGGLSIQWQGSSSFSSQLEHSRDLLAWLKLDLPAQETDAIMSLEIPAYLLDEGYRFFRLERRSLVTSAIPTTPGFYSDISFVHGGVARKYFLKVPSGWNAAQTWPLVFLLPGHGQSITEFVSNQQEILGLADSQGWILVFAEATAGTESYLWFSSDNPNATQPYIDDAAFLFALTDALKASGLRVNPNRVYASGFSNGGSMVHYLAGKPNHPFAAFAIIESGTASFSHYREPYNRHAPDSGANVPANVPVPWQPRPVLLMNMATSVPWTFEGQQAGGFFIKRGARHNVARWTQANGYGSVAQLAPEPPLPPAPIFSTNSTWRATGTDRARVAYEDVRPDHNWPTNLIATGWSQQNALRFPYVTLIGTNVVDYRLPESVRVTYPHALSADPASPATHVRVDSGTMTVEIWRTGLNNRTNEVIFVGLSDGGHQWPNSNDKLPFNANMEVLRFFDAH